MKPAVRWVGGKSRLLSTLRAHLPDDVDDLRHVELFTGSAALFFDRLPARALLCDSCGPLMASYRALRADVSAVLRSLAALQRYQGEEDYKRIRARFNARPTPDMECPKRAAEFFYLNAVGFNGIYRENSAGEMNTPWGEWPAAGVYRPDRLHSAAAALKGVPLHTCSALECSVSEGDFVYLDPPYLTAKVGSFRGYGAGFGLREHVRLIQLAEQWADDGARVMISNADTPAARELLRGGKWQVHTINARTSMGASGAARGAQPEIVATSYTVGRKRPPEGPGRTVGKRGARGSRRGAASGSRRKATAR